MMKPDLAFTLFDTAIGCCGIVWNAHGIAGVQLPERTEQATRSRMLRRYPAARQTEPPAERRAHQAASALDRRGTPWRAWIVRALALGGLGPAPCIAGRAQRRRTAWLNVKAIYMSWSKDDKGPRGYHHGNLKEALVRAALELIAQKGPAGFTFAEAARWAGVSPAAPYRHFRDRDELLANVALRGFELFENALARAWDNGQPDTSTAFDRLGKAYLAFARTEPAYYSAMFEAGMSTATSPELREAGDRAFAVLRAAAEKLCAEIPAQHRPPTLMVALHIWSMSHGIASLFGRGDAAQRKLPMSAEDLLEAGVLVYLRGLGAPDANSGR
jgi:AcrR family transcriptional regulator